MPAGSESTTHHVPSTSASTTAWKSIGREPRRVDRDQPGRDLQRAQQGDGQVRVVAAHALAGQQRVDGGVDRPARPGGVDQPPVHPVGDGGDQLGARQVAGRTRWWRSPRAGPTGSSGWAAGPRPTPPASPSARAPPSSADAVYVTVVSPSFSWQPVHAGAVGVELLGARPGGRRRARSAVSATGSATAICSSAVAGAGRTW